MMGVEAVAADHAIPIAAFWLWCRARLDLLPIAKGLAHEDDGNVDFHGTRLAKFLERFNEARRVKNR